MDKKQKVPAQKRILTLRNVAVAAFAGALFGASAGFYQFINEKKGEKIEPQKPAAPDQPKGLKK